MSSLPVGSASHQGEALPVVPGQVLGGKFRIERVIGEGGMGIVVEATHIQLEERVALKFLRREVMKMPEVVSRFDAEARAVVKLKSEHVARVSDVGRTEDGIPYMVMELLDGKDLGQMLSDQGPLPVSEAVEYIIQACEGVGEAHARGIVHRDLKPENLFLVKRGDWGVVKVLDFGISKAVLVGNSNVDLASSNTTSIMGSPYYMSPEQLRSTKSVDHRADIWSLGVVLFELLTGGTIFDETKEFTELVADILETPHRRLTRFRRDAPADLELVIDRCLDKDRTRRYQNVAELAIALLPFAPRRSRVSAERTTSIARAAGLITDPNFRLPPSNYPPAATPSGNPMVLESTVPPMPGLPSFSSVPTLAAPISSQLPIPPSTPSLPASESAASQNQEDPFNTKKKSPAILLVGVVLFFGCVAAFFFFNRQPTALATDGNPIASGLAAPRDLTPAATAAPRDSAPVAIDTASPSAVAAAQLSATDVAATSKPPPRKGPSTTSTAAPKASAGASASPQTKPSLDIQMER